MRILVVGTGGVGSAFAAIAQRRSFFDRITLADLDVSRPQSVVDRLGEPDRFEAAAIDASSQESIVALIRDVEGRRRAERDRPALQPADLRRLPRGRGDLSRHGRDALPAASRAALLRDRREARRLPVREARELGAGRPAGADRDRHRARRRGRVRAPRGGRAVLGDRRDRDPRRRQPRRRGLRLRPHLLDLDDDRGVPQPARDLGEGPRLVHDRAVLRARGLRLPRGDRPRRVRQRRARGGAPRARA